MLRRPRESLVVPAGGQRLVSNAVALGPAWGPDGVVVNPAIGGRRPAAWAGPARKLRAVAHTVPMFKFKWRVF